MIKDKVNVIKKIKLDSDTLESRVQALEGDLSGADSKICSLEGDLSEADSQLEAVENEKFQLHQRSAGLKSGFARHRCSTPKESLNEALMKNKSEGTEIEGVFGDLILIKKEESPGIHIGQRFFRLGEKKKLTSGFDNTYGEIPEDKEPSSMVTKKEIQRRAKFGMKLISKIAGPEDNGKEKELVLTEMIRANKELFMRAAEKAGIPLLQMLSPEQAANIRSLMRLPMNKVRSLRRCLSNLNANIFPSERKMRVVQSNRVSHVVKSAVESGFMGLHRTATDENVLRRSFVRVKNLEDYLREILEKEEIDEDERFNGKLWILFAGDKGGQHMKFHFECINTLKAGSVDNVHIFCMFEATDNLENMWKVFMPYHDQIRHLQEPTTKILGKELEIFLGGDYHFLDDCLGHQGSSASFPSAADLVELKHLQSHGGRPHTPKTCNIEERTVAHYAQSWSENLSDTRNNNNLRENGKYHYSVIENMLVPLKSLANVVPPGLHIMFGIVLNIYNMILTECRKLDELDGSDEVAAEEKEILSNEWEVKSIELENKLQQLTEIGEAVVDLENRYARISAIVSGDVKRNSELAKLSELGKKGSRKKRTLDKCKSAYCCITTSDENVNWVLCDSCSNWFHTMCECMSNMDELQLSEEASY